MSPAGRSSPTRSAVSVTGPTSSRRLRTISASASVSPSFARSNSAERSTASQSPSWYITRRSSRSRASCAFHGSISGAVRNPYTTSASCSSSCVADLRPGLCLHLLDRGGIEAAEVGGVLRVEQAIGRDGARAPPLGIAVVEEGVGPRAEHGMRERRGRREVAALHLQRAVLDPPKQREEAVHVHELAQAIVDRLLHERVIGDLPLAGQVLRAGELVGEHDGQQVLGVRALERRGHALAVPVPDEGERDRGVPAPARAEHRRVEQSLHEHVFGRVGLEECLHVLEREAVRRPEREHDAVLERGGLELEVELAAEALAQREAPGPVDARAEGRVDDEVGVAHVVEEALEHDGVERRQRAERRLAGGEVLGELRGRDRVELLLVAQPLLERLPARRRRAARARPRAGARPPRRARRSAPAPRRPRTAASAPCRGRPPRRSCSPRPSARGTRCCRAGRCRRACSRTRSPRRPSRCGSPRGSARRRSRTGPGSRRRWSRP